MQDNSNTILLLMDCQVGAADKPYAANAVKEAANALQAARAAKVLTGFTKIDFLPNYADVAPTNKTFSAIKAHGLFAPGTSTVMPELTPAAGEFVFNKDRFSPFYTNALNELIRAKSVGRLVLLGFSTSGVVLSAFTEAIDRDFEVTILSDACADPDTDLHSALVTKLFPRSATLSTVKDWAASLR